MVAHALLQGPPVARFDFDAMKAQAAQRAAHACTRPECFNGDHAHPPPPGRVAEGDADVDLGQTNVDAVFAMEQPQAPCGAHATDKTVVVTEEQEEPSPRSRS